MRDERECPHCAELILVRARVCKHCGRDVTPLSEASDAPPPRPTPPAARAPRPPIDTTSHLAEIVGITAKPDAVFTISALLIFAVIAADIFGLTPHIGPLRKSLAGEATSTADSLKRSATPSNSSAQTPSARTQFDSLLDTLSKPVSDNHNATASPPAETEVMGVKVNIPDATPNIELRRTATNTDFTSRTAHGDGPDADGVYLDDQVDKQVVSDPDSPSPKYPAHFVFTGAIGNVAATFVVDTTGRPIVSTIKILKSTHEAFEAAVRAALPIMHFIPAEIAGRKVKQRVQQSFEFGVKP